MEGLSVEEQGNREYLGGRRGGEKVTVRVEESRPGVVADALKAADQTVGDMGRVDEEGTIHVERRREKM